AMSINVPHYLVPKQAREMVEVGSEIPRAVDNQPHPPNTPSTRDALQVALRRHRERKLVLDSGVDLKTLVFLKKLPHGRLRVVALAPGSIGGCLVVHVVDQRVEHDEITTRLDQSLVRSQLGENVFMRVVGV